MSLPKGIIDNTCLNYVVIAGPGAASVPGGAPPSPGFNIPPAGGASNFNDCPPPAYFPSDLNDSKPAGKLVVIDPRGPPTVKANSDHYMHTSVSTLHCRSDGWSR